MAKAKSSLLAALGSEVLEAHEEFKATPVSFSAGGDPPPIDNGVAKLVDIRFSEIADENSENYGKLQFYASGVIVAPEAVEVNGSMIPVAGLRTRIIEPLYETPDKTRKSIKDHLAKVYNELKKLGLDTSNMTVEEIEQALPVMAEAGIHFRFRIWKGKKQTTGPYANMEPIANHEWNGVVDFEESSEDGVVEEAPVKAPSKAPAPKTSAPAAKATPAASKPTAKASPAPSAPTPPAKSTAPAKGKATAKAPAVPDIDVKSLSLEELLPLAMTKVVKAQVEITERAKELGIDSNSEEFGTWEAVVEAMNAAMSGEGTEEEGVAASDIDWQAQGEAADQGDQDAVDLINATAIELGLNPDEDSAWSETAARIAELQGASTEEAAEWSPAVGETYLYKAPKAKSAVPCEVTAVFEGKKTVNLKDGKNSYKGVSWDELTGE